MCVFAQQMSKEHNNPTNNKELLNPLRTRANKQSFSTSVDVSNFTIRGLGFRATVSRIDQIIGLFCSIASLLYNSFAKETCNFIDPTNQSHPI